MGSGIKKRIGDFETNTTSALGRIEAVEKQMTALTGGLGELLGQIQNSFQATEKRMSAVEKALNAIGERTLSLEKIANAATKVVGIEAIQKQLDEDALETAKRNAVAQVEALSKAVDAGQIAATDTIGDETLIVGIERDIAGNEVLAGRTQAWTKELVPELREELAGKGVGAVGATPGGGTLTVTELYRRVEVPPTEKPEEVQAETAAA